MSGDSTPKAPQDPGELRAEIAQTRSELADTAERLAAKTDVKARAKEAAGDAKARAKEAAGDAKQAAADAVDTAKERVSAAAGTVADKAGSAVSSVRRTVRDTDFAAEARKPLPWAAIAAGLAAFAAILYAVRRKRG
ncbi:DUF3618 domain-containing protein [Dactylosporangium sp. CS-033363]|uniref:DUF3618 domain-containing protein n=1 Tax=Dactylosporangium sp. CS-033363 TaxID=3239935 RepID=UPI003D8D2824